VRDRRFIIAFAAAAVVMAWVVATAVADDHQRQKHRHRDRERRTGLSGTAVPAVDNPTYRENCGACHFALQPALLPSRSWQLLLAGTQDHFGQSVDLEAEQLAEVEAYLSANAAEYTSGKLAQEIVDSIGSSTPLRVTDVPLIRHEHRRIDAAVFQRPSVAGRADCRACHPGADDGIYDDDSVTIPSR
jgi:hypothetical protein